MDFFWEKQGWEQQDRHLSALFIAPFQREFRKIELSAGITLIRGPRQVGKSTWLKKLLSESIQKSCKCFYYTCEDLDDHKELAELIRSQKEVTHFFLDEITYVKEWWRAIKKSVDSDSRLVFILTGSNCYDLRKGLDLMPGRWSESAGELSLLPMDFFEWQAMRENAGWKSINTLESLRLYMKVGGFPAALIESGAEGKIPTNAIKIYQRWIMGDVAKLNRQSHFMKELLLQIAKTTGSSLSLHSIAQKTQIMSYHTAQDYIEILEQAFALRTLYAYDPEKDSFSYKKEKKFYFTDPIVYWATLDLAGNNAPENYEEQLAEMIAAEYLSRRHKRLGYYSSRNGEVDFISGKDLAIEIKWAAVPGNLSKAYRNLNIANKIIWSQGTFFSPN